MGFERNYQINIPSKQLYLQDPMISYDSQTNKKFFLL